MYNNDHVCNEIEKYVWEVDGKIINYQTGQFNSDGVQICGSRKASWPTNATPCQSTALAHNGRCIKHGGAALAGIAHPNFKNGKHATALPTRILSDYDTLQQDRVALLDLHSDLALMDARILDLLKRVDWGEAGKIWQQAKEAMRDFKKARIAGDAAGMAVALDELDKLITRGNADYYAWDEVLKVMAERRKMITVYDKRMQVAGNLITRQQALTLFAQLKDVLVTHIRDADTLRIISGELNKLIVSN